MGETYETMLRIPALPGKYKWYSCHTGDPWGRISAGPFQSALAVRTYRRSWRWL